MKRGKPTGSRTRPVTKRDMYHDPARGQAARNQQTVESPRRTAGQIQA